MKPITGDIVIAAPVEAVFDFVADERNEPNYNHRMLEVRKVSKGPIGVGTRYQAVMHSRRGGTPLTIEVTRCHRPWLLASHSHMTGTDIDGTLTFAREGACTRLTWSWELQPHGVLRLLRPLMRALGTRQERANWEALKAHLEALHR